MRREIMYKQIDTIRALWRGEPMTRKNTFGKDVEIALYPKPVQKELSIWLTSSGNMDTFLSDAVEDVKKIVYDPFCEYLHSAIDLEQLAAQGGGVISGGLHHTREALPPEKVEELLDIAFERYFETAALMGTVASTAKFIQKLEVIGVDEIACLVDFGVAKEQVLASLEHLVALKDRFDID
jgi:hypothetical protein